MSKIEAACHKLASLPLRLHRDEQGAITIVSVFALLLLVGLLGMVMNVGRQVDGKIRMQNAADAATYSGGVVLARGMNTLTFTNHLLCDIFAVTAFMREARDQNSASYVPEILAAWTKVAPVFTNSGFPKFQALGPAILQKVPLEQQMVTAYSQWASATSQQILPLMEQILSQELIPQYQRAVTVAFPDIAQAAAAQVAQQNGEPDFGRAAMTAAMWRTSGQLLGGDTADADTRTLPVVDPELDSLPDQATYVQTAQAQRQWLAQMYLNQWNNETMAGFDNEAKMCQFGALWRSFTCGYLRQLLEDEYPNTNLPFVIRTPQDLTLGADGYPEEYVFLGVAYWNKLPEMMPKIFQNPTANSAVTFAEVRLFVPRQRLVWQYVNATGGGGPGPTPLGGVPGDFLDLPPANSAPPTVASGVAGQWQVGREGVPTTWDLLTQRWTCQLAPATHPALATILQTSPSSAGVTPPNLGSLNSDEIGQISAH